MQWGYVWQGVGLCSCIAIVQWLNCNSAMVRLQQCNGCIATVQWWECFIWVTRSCQHAAGQSVKIASIRENSEYYFNPIFDIFDIFVQILSCKNGCSKLELPIYMLKGNEMDILNNFSNKCCLKTQHRQEEFYIIATSQGWEQQRSSQIFHQQQNWCYNFASV